MNRRIINCGALRHLVAIMPAVARESGFSNLKSHEEAQRI